MPSTPNILSDIFAMRQRSVYDSEGIPFYIYAPDYTNGSSGIRILHYFCHILNELGEEAYIVHAGKTLSKLRTPLLTFERMREHFLSGKNPITVYPEIVHNNPANTPLIARWLLNIPGHLGLPVEFEAKDIICYYEPWCLPDHLDGHFLHIDPLNYSIFNNIDNPDDENRTLECFYAHKYFLQRKPIRKEHEHLTSLGHEIPRTPQEIASILRKAKVLYVYEPSGIINEAQACGCPVLLVRSEYWELPPDDSHHQLPGVAVYGEQNALEHARKGLALIEKKHAILRDDSWLSAKRFIETVYAAHQDIKENGKPIVNAVQDLWKPSISEREKVVDSFDQFYSNCGLFPPEIRDAHVNDAHLWYQREQLVSNIFVIHEQTDLPPLQIAQSILNNKKGAVPTEEGRERFLLELCNVIFDSVVEKEKHTKSDEKQLQAVCELLISDSFRLKHDLAMELRQKIIDWQMNFTYQCWIKHHALQEIDAQLHAERMMRWSEQPTFHIVMFVLKEDFALLADTIDSLGLQFYPNWMLTVIADSNAPDPMFDELEQLQWYSLDDGADPYAFLNAVVERTQSDWIWILPAGVKFEPQAFLQFGDYIDKFQHKMAFYCDDDLVNTNGDRHSPRFKPDFNLDLLRSIDYIGPLLCHRDLFNAVGGVSAFPAHENMDLAFKVYERVGAESIGHISDVLIHLPEIVTTYQSQAVPMQVVQAHLQRLEVNASVERGLLDNSIRVVYHWPEQPLVSIIIPTRDKIELVQPCVESVFNKNNYSNFEVLIVNNQSEDPDVLSYFEDVQSKYEGKVRVLDYPHPFNYAAISNMASKEANGEYLLFLNNDVEAIHPEWLERMVSHAQRKEVGVVGARLIYPETGRIQHAGVIVGLATIANHPFVEEYSFEESGYMGRLQVDQGFSAVTAACMLVRKSIYWQVGGMNEQDLPVLFNDVDLCLKVGKTGHSIVWTPFASLVHHASVSIKSTDFSRDRERAEKVKEEREYFFNQWQSVIAGDPAFNRNLSLAYTSVKIEDGLPVNWDVNFHDRKRVFGLPVGGGSGEYRVIQPFDAIRDAGLAQCEYYMQNNRVVQLSEYARMMPDIVVLQNAITDDKLFNLVTLEKSFPDVYRITTLDDLLTDLPEKSSVYKDMKRSFIDMKARLRGTLKLSNRVIVSTQPLAELCEGECDDIYIVPNRLPRKLWTELTSLRNQGDKPRVGWVGAQQHQGDLEIIVDVVKETAEEIDWVFMGMCPDELRDYVTENHDFVIDISKYPEKMASLNLDLAIAPLEIHPFNEAKSNLRLLEYGVLGWPVICTDIYPYRTNNPPVTYVSNDKNAWLGAIRDALSNPDALQKAGDKLREWVLRDYILEDHLSEWQEALNID